MALRSFSEEGLFMNLGTIEAGFEWQATKQTLQPMLEAFVFDIMGNCDNV